ncbi:hypothetical protein NB311A_14110 [Nitrobacter sp. Nb-311A]|nr:hypothetical protein NB311A_14110 [Nitrobacter sp. Nb-311A]
MPLLEALSPAPFLNWFHFDGNNSSVPARERPSARRVVASQNHGGEDGLGRGLLLWLVRIPIPLIILIVFLMHD